MTMYNRVPEQLALTKDAFASVLTQDIGPLDIWLLNNGSTEPTREWLATLPAELGEHRIHVINVQDNRSPVALLNSLNDTLFGSYRYEYVLGVPNDVVLPTNLYREMLRWPRGFVTASETGENPPPRVESAQAVSENTPMAVMLIRRWAWDAIMSRDGYFFDPGYFCYASDCDLALRMASCGIRGVQLDIPFYHFGSGHWRMLPEQDGRRETDKADVDRAYFERKWGFACDSLEYGRCATDPNFRASAD